MEFILIIQLPDLAMYESRYSFGYCWTYL